MRNGFGYYVYNQSNQQRPPTLHSSLIVDPESTHLRLVEEGEWVEDEFKGRARMVSVQEFIKEVASFKHY